MDVAKVKKSKVKRIKIVQNLLFSVAKTANIAFMEKMKLKRIRSDNTFKIEE
jgi:hypothetical protein